MFTRRQPAMWLAALSLLATSSAGARVHADERPVGEKPSSDTRIADRTPADKPASDPSGATLVGEVFVLLASETDGTIDPSLSHLRALKHPPFNNFKSINIQSRSPIRLVEDQPVEVGLPNGRKVHLTLLARLPDGRAKVQVSINRPNQRDYLPLLTVIASPGEPFFVAGQKFEGATLVIGVRVGERPKRAT